MSDVFLPDFPEYRRAETGVIADSGGSHRDWNALPPATRASVDQLCQNVEVAIQTRRRLNSVRALQRHFPRDYALLKAIAEAPDEISGEKASEGTPVPLMFDPVVRDLCCAASHAQTSPVWLKRLEKWLPLASFVAFGGLVVLVTYCYKIGAVR